ncbi:hypothetical protein [[Muricauda] lutisoli]|uniref:Lipoprotein n=1 Tax=[Muricauda] lutisoli TaxID=2816035 RepID=A0ABS3EXF5_9FLAO|nr:hypothetical protein [[Muricauda] lutisoli]MBO0330417.1 hypothetical protein [[Muricauda] lutisoli]
MSKKILLLLVTVLAFSCNADNDSIDLDCSAVLCAAADNMLYLKFLNPENDEDLLANGTININLIEIVNEKSADVTFTVEEYPDMGMFLIIPISTESFGQKSFTIDFYEGDSFTVSFETSLLDDGGCCGPYTTIASFSLDNYSHELVEPSFLPVFSTVYIPNLD